MRVAQWHAFGAVALICWAQWHASTRLGWGWPLHVVWGGQGSGVALRRLFAPSWWWIGVAAGISVLVPWPPSGCSTGCGTPCSARSSRVPPSPCCGMGELPNRCGSIQLIQPVVGIAGTHRSQRALGVLGAPFCIGPAQLDVLMHLARHSSILCRCKGWSGPWCSSFWALWPRSLKDRWMPFLSNGSWRSSSLRLAYRWHVKVYGLIAGALTRAQGGWACTSARTSPTPFLFFLIGWLGGHGARNGMQLFSVYSISCASVTRITLAPNVFCRGGGIA